jgi:hypothetical protein
MYIIIVIKCSRPSAAAHSGGFIPAVSQVEWNYKVIYNAFSRSPKFVIKNE